MILSHLMGADQAGKLLRSGAGVRVLSVVARAERIVCGSPCLAGPGSVSLGTDTP